MPQRQLTIAANYDVADFSRGGGGGEFGLSDLKKDSAKSVYAMNELFATGEEVVATLPDVSKKKTKFVNRGRSAYIVDAEALLLFKTVSEANVMSEHHPKTVTTLRDKEHVANMKMSPVLYNRRLHVESVLSAPEQDCEGDIGFIFCSGGCILGIILNRLRVVPQRKTGCVRHVRRRTCQQRKMSHEEHVANGCVTPALRS